VVMSVDQASSRSGDSNYVLVHVEAEIRRLLLQARLHDDFTEHALRLAGLRPGMRVLDIGCGPGDVAFLAARLVGPSGTVLGVDAAAEIIELARTRAAERGLDNVSFEPTAIADISVDEPVDAVIGRLILMHLPDPVATLRHLAAMVRRGGLIAVFESDITAAGSRPELPLWRTVKDAIAEAFLGAGADRRIRPSIAKLFVEARAMAHRRSGTWA
jgi:2-polyprenyl-3-methyl-5-hydroxy-6-metoxy-1,4-benzoquinol methylase